MPDIPINQKPYTNVDSLGNTAVIHKFIDADKDDFMNNEARPGLGGDTNNYFIDLGTGFGVDGVFQIDNYSFAAVFSGGKLFRVTETGIKTEITGATLNIGTPVSFADFGNVGYFCNNSKILKWTYTSGTCAFISDVDAPTDATHVAFFDSYLLALSADSATISYSDVAAPDTWLAESFTAVSRPDNAAALYAAFGELFIPGTATIENWADTGDANDPFQRIPGTITERGTLSPYSVTQIDNSFYFLDTERRVIRMAGRDPQVISNPFDNEFQDISTVTDAIGFHFNPEGATKYVLYFPTDGKTFAYDYKLDYWVEYSFWDNGTREAFLAQCGAYIPRWGQYVAGSRKTGKLYIASYDYIKDESNYIISEIQTGRIDWNTVNYKKSRQVQLRLKRGNAAIGETGATKLFFAYRDNGSAVWGGDRVVDLGAAGETFPYARFWNLGRYRDRQYRIRWQGARTKLTRITEDVMVS